MDISQWIVFLIIAIFYGLQWLLNKVVNRQRFRAERPKQGVVVKRAPQPVSSKRSQRAPEFTKPNPKPMTAIVSRTQQERVSLAQEPPVRRLLSRRSALQHAILLSTIIEPPRAFNSQRIYE
jgi:hypothetical protein